MHKRIITISVAMALGVASFASPSLAFWNKTDTAAKETAWRSAVGSLENHGIDASQYILAFDHIETFNKENAAPFIYALVADLRYGVTRDALNDVQKAELMRNAKSLLATCQQPADCLQNIAARHEQYAALQRQLSNYRDYAQNGMWPSLHGGQTIKTGMHNARVPDIRNLLRLTGDLPAAVEVADPLATLYDAVTQQAVERFQSRHGLDVDGSVGPATLAAMQISPELRARQIALTLERMRRYEAVDSENYILVNVPSYHLQAIAGEKVALAMDVIVGKKDRATPLFNNSINTVVVNPTWTPTYKILTKDLLPKFRNDPEYIERGGYKVYDRADGYELDPYSVDWEQTSANDVRVVQSAGARNALGKVKFLLPDNDAIYLHDTSKRQLFSEASRALSSGCVRLSDPKALMDFVLAAQGDAQADKGSAAWAGEERTTMRLKHKIPVKVTYYTASIGDEGMVHFHSDIYRKNDALVAAMSKHNPQYAMRQYRLAMLPSDAPGLSQYAQNQN